MRPNLGFYVQTINDIVKTTEDIGEVMNPYYEEVRQAIDKNKVNDLTAERIAEIQAKFKEGTEKYNAQKSRNIKTDATSTWHSQKISTCLYRICSRMQ